MRKFLKEQELLTWNIELDGKKIYGDENIDDIRSGRAFVCLIFFVNLCLIFAVGSLYF